MSEVIEHETSEDCICGPTLEVVRGDDGSVGFLYIHHTLEGSELHEIPREAI